MLAMSSGSVPRLVNKRGNFRGIKDGLQKKMEYEKDLKQRLERTEIAVENAKKKVRTCETVHEDTLREAQEYFAMKVADQESQYNEALDREREAGP